MASNKKQIFNYSGQFFNYQEDELLSNFLKFYPLTNYKVITSVGGTTRRRHRAESPRLVILDNKNNCYYKVFPKRVQPDIEKYDHKFINNAYFPNHLVTSIIKENLWIIKQTIPTGNILTEIFNKENKVDNKIIDSILNNLMWSKQEADRIFLNTPKHKYWNFAQQLDIGGNNLVYDIQNNSTTNIDIEPSNWLTRDQYLMYAYKRLTKHLWNWSRIPGCSFLSTPEIPKILDKCIMFIDNEIL